jgi:hypothetical protein
MALAILELVDLGRTGIRLAVDTGTNKYYQLKVGRKVRRDHGIDWVDDVHLTTPLAASNAGGDLLRSPTQVRLPTEDLGREPAFVQLFSYKSPQGRSPAFSEVLRLDPPRDRPTQPIRQLAQMEQLMNVTFQAPRRVPCRTGAQAYARQASLGDLLDHLLKIAGPIVLDLLTKAPNGAPQGVTTGETPSNGSRGQPELLAGLLKAVLGSIGTPTAGPMSYQQSLATTLSGNRFTGPPDTDLSRPFIFGVDDALIGALIGPLVQVLPQLLNSVNQQKLQLRQANNKLVTDLLSDVNRRMLLDRVLDAKRQAAGSSQPGGQVDLDQLVQLLQQAGAGSAAVPAPAPPTAPSAGSQTLSVSPTDRSLLSSRAVVSFVTADPVCWNGTQRIVFAKGQKLQQRVRLNVSEPAPTRPLPKAILKITFKGVDEVVLYEKTVKLRDVAPRSTLPVDFTPGELAHLPADVPIVVLAELRWLAAKGSKVCKALGSSEIMLVGRYFLQEQGAPLPSEQELTDLKRFRPFWNKIWESPALDAAHGDPGKKKYLWELDVTGKYTVLLSAPHEANGLMETRVLRAQEDDESVADRTQGRLKAGIELSVAELNKLASLWDAGTALDPERLEAFRTDTFARANASEFVHRVRLKGKAGQRGMVWVGPILQLFEFTLATPQKVEETGQVIAVAAEKVRFPLPVAARVIGLRSE